MRRVAGADGSGQARQGEKRQAPTGADRLAKGRNGRRRRERTGSPRGETAGADGSGQARQGEKRQAPMGADRLAKGRNGRRRREANQCYFPTYLVRNFSYLLVRLAFNTNALSWKNFQADISSILVANSSHFLFDASSDEIACLNSACTCFNLSWLL